jgi:hypothetical protein
MAAMDAKNVKRRADIVEVVGRYAPLAPRGDEYVGLCPFHQDEKPSLTVNREKGLWHCFGCGAGGDAISFVERIERIGFKEAVGKLASEHGMRGEEGRGMSTTSNELNTRTSDSVGLTLEAYSAAKKLPIEFLKGIGVTQIFNGGVPVVRIPYRDPSGEERSVRFRCAMEGASRFRWRTGDKPMLYGLWRLADAREAGHVVLAEGESDTQTLWHSGLPAIGLPGACVWKEDWACHFEGIGTVYVVIERDEGGKQVLRWLERSAIRDRARLVDLGDAKDPSGLFLLSPDDFRQRWERAVNSAARWADVRQCARSEEAATAFEQAEPLLRDPGLVDRIRDAMRELGHAGELTAPLLVYFAVTSRLFRRPLNLALVAPSAAGKNRSVDTALELVPSEYVITFGACSEKAMIYDERSYEHRTIVMGEADSIPKDGPAASLLRSICASGSTDYLVTESDPKTGRSTARRITMAGPTGIITTSTKPLPHQMATRMLEIPLRDDEEQIRAILTAQAQRAMEESPAPPAVDEFLAAQRWLELAGERVVVVPFARVLKELLPARTSRMSRDFPQLLTLIQVIAFTHQLQRRRTSAGSVIAEVVDYALAHTLVGPVFEAIATQGLTDVIRQTVNAVPRNMTVTLTDLAKQMDAHITTVHYRVQRALKAGWLVNDEWRKGWPMKLRRGVEMPGEASILPHPWALEQKFRDEQSRAEDAGQEGQSELSQPSDVFNGSSQAGEKPPLPHPRPTGAAASGGGMRCTSCGGAVRPETLGDSGRCPDCSAQNRAPF